MSSLIACVAFIIVFVFRPKIVTNIVIIVVIIRSVIVISYVVIVIIFKIVLFEIVIVVLVILFGIVYISLDRSSLWSVVIKATNCQNLLIFVWSKTAVNNCLMYSFI